MENTKTREPQQKRSIEKKNRIIEVGFHLMCKHGYQKTTTADIAKAAGVSTGIIYNYFKDKRDIFICGLQEYGNQMMSLVYEEITPNIDIRSSIETLIDAIANSHYIFQFGHQEIEALTMMDNEIATIMHENELRITTHLESVITGAGFESTNLSEKTHIIYNMVESYCHELIFHHHTSLDYTKMRELVIDSILFLLGPQNK